MRNPVWPVSIKGVLVRNQNVLLLRNPRDEWELPGGRLEFGESPEQCLTREISEECGFEVKVITALLIEPFEVIPGKQVLIIAYGCEELATKEPTLSDEHREFRWMPIDDLETEKVPDIYTRAIRTREPA
jgi:mutator protein MutT